MSGMPGLWEFVFNSEHRRGWSVKEAAEMARAAEYPMFTWNGEVFRVPPEGAEPLSQPVGIKISNIRGNDN